MHSVSSVDPHHDTGFTLVEIVMVLVLLGLLAAAATPKFFDNKSSPQAHDFSHWVRRKAPSSAFL